MKVSILASGSNGNATVIETADEALIIDDGLSFKSLYERMNLCNINIEKLKGIMLTHEHVDHISGVKVLLKRLPLISYLSKGTFDSLNIETKNEVEKCGYNIVKNEDQFFIGKLKITVIQTHHDAKEPIGFIIEKNDKKIVYITDTGYVDQVYYPMLKNANLYVMESNYDVELLWSSGRPFELKKRIDGDHGHMSNVTSAILLAKLIGDKTKHVVFAHISDDCNYYDMPKLILKEHLKIYQEIGVDVSGVEFTFGNRFGVTGVIEL